MELNRRASCVMKNTTIFVILSLFLICDACIKCQTLREKIAHVSLSQRVLGEIDNMMIKMNEASEEMKPSQVRYEKK